MRLFKKKLTRRPPEPEPVYDFSDLPRAAGFGNTVFVDPRDLFLAQRTEINPLPALWICEYCNCVNPSENVHCEHCGAPHIKKQAKEKPSETVLRAALERLLFRWA